MNQLNSTGKYKANFKSVYHLLIVIKEVQIKILIWMCLPLSYKSYKIIMRKLYEGKTKEIVLCMVPTVIINKVF